LEETGDPIGGDERLAQQRIDHQRHAHVPPADRRLDATGQGHLRHEGVAADQAHADPEPAVLDDERRAAAGGDHLPVHPVDPEALLLHQAERSEQVGKGPGSGHADRSGH